MLDVLDLSIKNIVKADKPLYVLGAMSRTSKRLLGILKEHSVRIESVWDENWLEIMHTEKYAALREAYRARGCTVEPIPVDVSTVPPGVIFVACEERFQRKWLSYCNRSVHEVYDAQDIILWPVHFKCASQNAGNPDLLTCCRKCRASYRSCPVREGRFQAQSQEKKDKVIRHIAIKSGFICNLRCEYCCEFIPRFNKEHKKPFDADGTISDIRKLSSSLEYIDLMSFSGGDVMLNRGLAEVIRQTVKLDNIGDIYILTNGTYVPHEDILSVIEENRDHVRIVINNYAVNNEAEILIAELDKRHLNYRLRDNSGWYELNDLAFRNRSVNELKDLYNRCSFDKNEGYYYIMIEGKLNLRCGVANGILYYLEKHDEHKQDHIDVRKLSVSEIPAALTALEDRGYLDACNFCAGCSLETRTIGAAADQL